MTDEQRRVVVADASVLINLIHVSRLDLCSRLPGISFVVPDHVRDEIKYPDQREAFDRAVEGGVFQIVSITDLADIADFSNLTAHLGRGEAACLVLASRNGWDIACDEKGRFRREALERLDADRILGTVQVYVMALEGGLLTVEQADEDKALLAERRFQMPFESFREVFPAPGRDEAR